MQSTANASAAVADKDLEKLHFLSELKTINEVNMDDLLNNDNLFSQRNNKNQFKY